MAIDDIELVIKEDNLEQFENNPVVICSLGDNSVTEGEVSEAFQFAALHQLPIIFLINSKGKPSFAH